MFNYSFVSVGNIPSRASSSSRRKGPSRGSKPLPDGKKKKVGVNSWGQPIQGVNSYSRTIGTLTRNHIPINYKKFTNVPDEFIHIAKIELELTFDLRRVANLSIMQRMNNAWKRHKFMLNKKYIKGSKQENTKNCNNVMAPCTTGQTSMVVVHLNLVVERNVSDEDVGRADVFIKAHTKADKTYQCPKIITLRKDKKGHMMVMGIDITPSFVANAIHIVEENEDLKATNNELKVYHKYNPLRLIMQQKKQSDLNRECKLNGCPEGIVVYGIIADIIPDAYCHNKQFRDGYYK
ncbi:hypothetical protein GIB67_023923 [Kingdonia uniflora]|uniref:Uncharacterized protein n=1 Tax=Kingdonia uniflora TaxID=39325 RepID=A0A7J7NW19_9MAGN|nr:hypothetical protein GIB67_036961 [Kingdonia uniflora]KAF6174118.1 hypothetical protein GIB67_023923 [Kingdonia uniflora]